MIEIGGFFYLRRLSFFGWWEYLDQKADIWWMKKKEYNSFSSLNEVKECLFKYQENLKNSPKKPKIVVHKYF
jgi:flagellar biosynthesis chaperone FliJ